MHILEKLHESIIKIIKYVAITIGKLWYKNSVQDRAQSGRRAGANCI